MILISLKKEIIASLISHEIQEQDLNMKLVGEKFGYSEKIIMDIFFKNLTHLSLDLLFTLFQNIYHLCDTAYLMKKGMYVDIEECGELKVALQKLFSQKNTKKRGLEKKKRLLRIEEHQNDE